MKRFVHRPGCPSRSSRRGAAMVEFALLAPIFLALILGVVEMGNALDSSNVMTAAVREGGRLATMDWKESLPDGMTINQKVIADIQNFLAAAGVPADDVSVSITSAEPGQSGQPFDLGSPSNNLKLFKIEATIPFDSVSSYPSTYMGGRNVTSSLVFRAGRVNLVN